MVRPVHANNDRLQGTPTPNKVMVIGSGPIIIGQAAEFDYAGSQACRSLREAGFTVTLLNSNPATIMTDLDMADAVYLEPLTLEMATAVIAQERPAALLPTLGGQVGLNLAVELADAGVLEKYDVQLLGTPLETIRMAEDRQQFKEAMLGLGQPLPRSAIAHSVDEALTFAAETGYPLIVRPAYTLGGTGGGFAADAAELQAIARRGLRLSPVQQILVEESVAGWKEIEYEVIRDKTGQAIIVCGMENVDPVGVHTGDSIVTAPVLTLSPAAQSRLEEASLTIAHTLGIEGGCNVQFAIHPDEDRYVVLEVNPRVSRSSALASKATGFPIAKVAALIATGRSLQSLPHPNGQGTVADYEARLDYVVVKIPRWPFDKFHFADRRLGSQMKATGEVMAIGDTFTQALLKAVRSLELDVDAFADADMARLSDRQLEEALANATDDRVFAVAEGLRRGLPAATVARLSGIDGWFIDQIHTIVALEQKLAAGDRAKEDPALLAAAVTVGMGDAQLAGVLNTDEGKVRRLRQEHGLQPVYKAVGSGEADAVAANPAAYFYSAPRGEKPAAAPPSAREKVLVLGAGPIRIGQGIEFDYCTVHAIQALQQLGYEAQIINNNPETVSTDFDTADRLFFEPLALGDTLNLIDAEKPIGVVAQFGGQTAINLAGPLAAAGVKLLGTPVTAIDDAEDRDKMDVLLQELSIPRPKGGTAADAQEAIALARRIGYPLMVRPSYVLGGRGMEVVHDAEDLTNYVQAAVGISPGHPLWIDAFIPGVELDVDAVCDGEQVLVPGILEHVERAGVHSGDSAAVYPPYALTPEVQQIVVDYTTRIALRLGIVGLLNIQFVVDDDGKVHVLEVNPRASRTVPFLSKVTGVPMVELATRAMLGGKLADLGYKGGLLPAPNFFAVKMPVFSWAKLPEVDVALGPEMKSTGEVIGLDGPYGPALYKAFQAAGFSVPHRGTLLISIADRDKEEALPLVQRFARLGFKLLATAGTATFLKGHGLEVELVAKLGEERPHLVDRIRSGDVDLVVNTLTIGRRPQRDGFRIRRAATEHAIPCLTSLDTAAALLDALESVGNGAAQPTARPLHQYLAEHPGSPVSLAGTD